ncbi:MAG: GAF domain-containing SpoIIE family protein phosphatase [Actinomycetota bacterium]
MNLLPLHRRGPPPSRKAVPVGAETAGERLALLSSFTREITGTLDPEGVVALLAHFVVPRLASWCVLHTVDEDTGQLKTPTVLHERASSDPGIALAVERLRELAPERLHEDGPIWQVLRGDVPHVFVENVQFAELALLGTDAALAEVAPVLGLTSMIIVPLSARDRIIGAFGIAAGNGRRRYTRDDLALVLDLAVRAGLMIENAGLYARERNAAAILQRGLLPELPVIDGVELRADYVPAMSHSEVGGDWYDVFPLADGQVGIAIGDVMGHDFAAATTMGSLRYVLRSYAWPGCAPDQVLNQVDELVHGMSLGLLATCIYGRLTPPSTGSMATFQYANAGHPPPLLVHPDGRVDTLAAAHGVMIGVQNVGGARDPRSCASVSVPRGGKIVCFTDGLLDADDGELDEALEQVRASIWQLGPGATCARIVDHLITRARDTVPLDDVAVLVVGVD